MTDLFHCRPLSSAISRQACGARYERRIGKVCETCAVGRQHANGALVRVWPDGEPLAMRPVTVKTMAQLRVHLTIIETHEAKPLRGALICGRTIREHAERAGLAAQVVRQRLRRGETLEQATSLAPRKHDRRRKVIEWCGRELSIREFARELDAPTATVHYLLQRGASPRDVAMRYQ